MSTVTSPHLFGLNGGEKKKQQILKHFSLFPPPLLGNCLCEFLLLLFVFRPRSKLDLLNYLKHFIHRLKMTKNSSISIHHFFQITIVRNETAGDIRGSADSGRHRGILWLLSVVRCFMRISTSSQSRAREGRDVSGQQLLTTLASQIWPGWHSFIHHSSFPHWLASWLLLTPENTHLIEEVVRGRGSILVCKYHLTPTSTPNHIHCKAPLKRIIWLLMSEAKFSGSSIHFLHCILLSN